MTVEDHYKEGGIFDAVTSAVIELGNVKVFGIAVDSVPRSGTPEELLALYKLDEKGIYDRIKSLIWWNYQVHRNYVYFYTFIK